MHGGKVASCRPRNAAGLTVVPGVQAAQLLRLGSVWGKNSIIFPDIVTDWTAAGWFCRIYLTAALGFFQPFCSLMTLLMFVGVVRCAAALFAG